MAQISVDLAIIGAGTAGIAAYKEASKFTDKILLIDHGPLGTTCARVGCMPSKALLQVANTFYHRNYFSTIGINGGNNLTIDIPAVMNHVRKLRDYFLAEPIRYVEGLGDRFIKGNAEFLDPNLLQVGTQKIQVKNTLIATGATPIIPREWQTFSEKILTSLTLFEQTTFANQLAVIGAGPIGLELGQALSRLGIEIEIFHSRDFIGGLTDPVVNACAIQIFREEFRLHLNEEVTIKQHNAELHVQGKNNSVNVKQMVAAVGQKPNLEHLNLAKLGVPLDKKGVPLFDESTMKITDFPIYIAGDTTKFHPLLYEAADAGFIAGYNATQEQPLHFARRVPLMLIFSQPNIAIIGKSFKALQNTDFIIGEASFEDQGRSRIMQENKGIVRIYADPKGKLLGAEMIAPEGEHLAHLIACAIQQNMTALELLRIPFYHPTVEEGLRTALRSIMKKISHKGISNFELRNY